MFEYIISDELLSEFAHFAPTNARSYV